MSKKTEFQKTIERIKGKGLTEAYSDVPVEQQDPVDTRFGKQLQQDASDDTSWLDDEENNEEIQEVKDVKSKEYLVNGGLYFPNLVAKRSDTLPPGAYECAVTNQGEAYLKPIEIVTDKIVDLGGDSIKEEIDLFWSKGVSEKFEQYGLVHKRGILVHGPAGCHAAGTKVLMYDGTVKNVEIIQENELLMGPDSTPRRVLRPITGKEQMVRIVPTKGESFVCNINHILSLRKTGTTNIINITVADYLKMNDNIRYKLYRTGVDFNKNEELEIDPYIFGMWLGDGTSRKAQLTSMDDILVNEWKNYAKFLNMQVRTEDNTIGNKAKNYHMINIKNNEGKNPPNVMNGFLRTLNVLQNKHIPLKYLTSSKENRLKLLAGLIDTDGYLDRSNCFEIATKFDVLKDNILFLARSLGFAAYSSIKVVKGKMYHRINISGEISEIPTKLSRKKATKRKQIKNVLNTGFKVEFLSVDNYYGFELDKDHLYLLSDFTVTHNTGKTIAIAKTARHVVDNLGGIVLFNPAPSYVKEFVRIIREVEPDKKVVIMWEEFDEVLTGDESLLLSLLDGEIQFGNIVYLATTNYISKIPARIKNRPSRFAKIIEINKPTKEQREAFLTAKLHESDKDKLPALIQASEGFVIDQVKDLIISTCCFNYSIDVAVRKIKEMEQDSTGVDDYNETQRNDYFKTMAKDKKVTPLQPLR